MIYFDNAATTAILPEVVETMTKVLSETYGNPSSVHTFGHQAAKLLREARESIAKTLEVTPNTITFTSGASESNNTAIVSYALSNPEKGKHIITTAIEHPSVIEAVEYLVDKFGYEADFVKPDENGLYSTQQFLDLIRPDTVLVSVMMVNNETGQILPVAELGQALSDLSDKYVAFHVDATQAMGKIPVLPEALHADFVSASAHKFHGPKGVGILYHADRVHFKPLIHGGEQENDRRAGTENLASIVGMAQALTIESHALDENYQKVKSLREQLISGLKASGLDFYENRFGESLPYVINLAFPKSNHDLLLTQLDLKGIAVSTGSACTAGAVTPSYVLEAIYGKDAPELKENIRVSLSKYNTPEEIDQLISNLKGLLH